MRGEFFRRGEGQDQRGVGEAEWGVGRNEWRGASLSGEKSDRLTQIREVGAFIFATSRVSVIRSPCLPLKLAPRYSFLPTPHSASPTPLWSCPSPLLKISPLPPASPKPPQ